MDKLENIAKLHYQSLHETDLYILGYICHHKSEVRKMSIQELAKCCNISHTSILRFCQKLELDGFSELKLHLKYELKQQPSVDETILSTYIHEYQQVAEYMKNLNLNSILKMMDQAARCFIYCASAEEQHAALELKRQFLNSQKVFHIVGKKEELDALLGNVDETDVFLIFSMKEDTEVTSLLNNLQMKHIQAIAICPFDVNTIIASSTAQITYHMKNHQAQLKNSALLFILVEMLYLKFILYKQTEESSNL